MIKVEIEKNVWLTVDFKKLLTPREEEVIAYRFAGNSKESTADIMGISKHTVNAQNNSAFAKTNVVGVDNPLSLLQSKAFANGWAHFVLCILFSYGASTGQADSRTQVRVPRTNSRNFRESFI